MKKESLKELIVEHKERFLSKKGLIKREAQGTVENYLKHREIVLITGVRRGGKSSLMRLICDDLLNKYSVSQANILYLNFEDERLIDFSIKDFDVLYEMFMDLEEQIGRKYFFLDEIQNVKNWEKWANRLYEFEDVKLFVTGSNISLLGSEVSAAITGRNRQIVNWPFSFREFLSFKGCSIEDKGFYLKDKRVILKRLFREYLRVGGFPEVIKNDDITLLEQYFKDIIYRDVIARYSIRNIREIKELTLFLASNIGTVQSYKNLRDLIGVKSINTVKNYIEELSSVFLFFFIDMFSYSVKKQIYNPSKMYCIDNALSRSISFKFSENLGHIYENLAFLELKRRNENIFYWKSAKGKEVDFVTQRGRTIDSAVQVAVSLSDKKTMDREITALLAANNEIKPRRLLILTEDEEGDEIINNVKIRIKPLWKWLLERKQEWH